MDAASMPTELVLLGWSVVLLLVHIAAQGASNAWDLDLRYLMTARDEGRKASNVYNGRLVRALANFSETYPAFVALALGLAVSGKAGGIGGALGAHLWFWSRCSTCRPTDSGSRWCAPYSGPAQCSGWC